MKYLISIIIFFFSVNVFAKQQDIVAIVNDKPITMYEFTARKKMIIALNKVDNSDLTTDKQLNKNVLNLLIDEELLNQHAEKTGIKISEPEIDSAILTIEERNKMPKGYLLQYMKELGINADSFKKQIKSELIKYNIVSSLSNSISVSPKELDVAVINSGYEDFNITAWIFTSLNPDNKNLNKMQKLQKAPTDCNKIENKLYADFASSEKIERKLKDLGDKTKSVILDTNENSWSNIYQEDDKFKLVLVCTKKASVSGDEIDKVKSFLSTQKMSKKAEKFFKDLKSKAYISILLND
jgi:hypothetical protein